MRQAPRRGDGATENQPDARHPQRDASRRGAAEHPLHAPHHVRVRANRVAPLVGGHDGDVALDRVGELRDGHPPVDPQSLEAVAVFSSATCSPACFSVAGPSDHRERGADRARGRHVGSNRITDKAARNGVIAGALRRPRGRRILRRRRVSRTARAAQDRLVVASDQSAHAGPSTSHGAVYFCATSIFGKLGTTTATTTAHPEAGAATSVADRAVPLARRQV